MFCVLFCFCPLKAKGPGRVVSTAWGHHETLGSFWSRHGRGPISAGHSGICRWVSEAFFRDKGCFEDVCSIGRRIILWGSLSFPPLAINILNLRKLFVYCVIFFSLLLIGLFISLVLIGLILSVLFVGWFPWKINVSYLILVESISSPSNPLLSLFEWFFPNTIFCQRFSPELFSLSPFFYVFQISYCRRLFRWRKRWSPFCWR